MDLSALVSDLTVEQIEQILKAKAERTGDGVDRACNATQWNGCGAIVDDGARGGG